MSIQLRKDTKNKLFRVMELLGINKQEINEILREICDFILGNEKLIYYLGASLQEKLANKLYCYLEEHWKHNYNPNVEKAMFELEMDNDQYRFQQALNWLELITIRPDKDSHQIKRIIRSENCKKIE